MARLAGRVEKVEQGLVRLDGRVEKVEQGLVRLDGRVEKVELELAAFRQDVTGRFDSVDEKLGYFGEKWMEHDQAIFQLKRKQA